MLANFRLQTALRQLGRAAHVRMEHHVNVHGLADGRAVVRRHLHRKVFIRVDGDRDRELVHRHVLSTAAGSTVHVVTGGRHNRVHFRNGDQRQEDDVLVDDPELEERTTANDFSIACHVPVILVRMQETNRDANDLEHLGRNDVRVFDVGITERFHLRSSGPNACGNGRQQRDALSA